MSKTPTPALSPLAKQTEENGMETATLLIVAVTLIVALRSTSKDD